MLLITEGFQKTFGGHLVQLLPPKGRTCQHQVRSAVVLCNCILNTSKVGDFRVYLHSLTECCTAKFTPREKFFLMTILYFLSPFFFTTFKWLLPAVRPTFNLFSRLRNLQPFLVTRAYEYLHSPHENHSSRSSKTWFSFLRATSRTTSRGE